MIARPNEFTGWESHPVLLPAWDEESAEKRRMIMELERADPLRYGHELGVWKLADGVREELRKKFPAGVVKEINLGGNRAAKSARAAKRVVQSCVEKAGSIWWCCDSTEAQSRMNQQRFIWRYLPSEWRNEITGSLGRTRSKTTKVRYSVAGGFTENNLVLPNGSEVYFKFYEMDVKNLPGSELDGIWADELIPLAWVETLLYRLTNRNGIFHITFTPEQGWTATVGHFLEDAKTITEVDAPLLPKFDEQGNQIGFERVPRVQQCADETARVIYFHTADNPYGNYEGMKQEVKGKSRDEIAMRVYGVVSKSAHAQFPLFKESVHVMSVSGFEALRPGFEKGEKYHLVDPCSGRNWFMIWVWCVGYRKWIVYREWPSFGHIGAYVPGHGDPGPWAVTGDAHDGERGSAQKSFGFGLERYKSEIDRLEKGEKIIERWIDARYANSPKEEREGTTTLIEQMSEIGLDFLAATGEKKILDTPDGSIDMINSALYYDVDTEIGKFSATLAKVNVPELQVLETCPNTIYALKNWTGKDGQQGAAKDAIDCLRMMFLSRIDYIGSEGYAYQGGGCY